MSDLIERSAQREAKGRFFIKEKTNPPIETRGIKLILLLQR